MCQKVLTVKGQKTSAARGTFELCVHIGIYNVYLAYLTAIIEIEQQLAYLSGAADGGVLRGIKKAALDLIFDSAEMCSAVFSDNEQPRVRMGIEHCLSLTENILIIRAGKPLICRYNKAGIGINTNRSTVGRIKIFALDIIDSTEDTLYLTLERVEIRAGHIKLRLRLSQLCRGNKIHGVRYLLSVADARHSILYFLSSRHFCSPADVRRKSSQARRMRARLSSLSTPLAVISLHVPDSLALI